MRDGATPPATIFPTAGAAATVEVSPGETLPVMPVLGPEGGKLVVTALFSDHPRPVRRARRARHPGHHRRHQQGVMAERP